MGISPRRIYFLSFGLSGFIAALGGMYMSMGYLTWFARDMIAGRGMIAMSAMNIAAGEPVSATLCAALWLHTSFAWQDLLGFAAILVMAVLIALPERASEKSTEKAEN